MEKNGFEVCDYCESRSTRDLDDPLCRVCYETLPTTTDEYEAIEDQYGDPIHADGCGCVNCTGGRHAEGPTYYADPEAAR